MFSSLFSRILVPFDGSLYSKKALTKAIEVAHNVDSEILLFTVINVGYVSPPGLLRGLSFGKSEKEAMKKWKSRVKSDTEKMLAREVEQCKKKGVSAKYKIGSGNISQEILKISKNKKISIIIIGSNGLHGIGKLKSLGSVSRRVSELADCPVMIVR